MAARHGVFKWFLSLAVALSLVGASGCLISFDPYPEGGVCDAGRDAGIPPRNAPDPVLRGCDAGPEPEANGGAAGAEDSP